MVRERQWVTSPELLVYPYTVLDTDKRQGTLVEITFPDPVPEPTMKELMDKIEKIKTKIGA